MIGGHTNDTPAQKLARSNNGGEAQTQRSKLDVVWDAVQAQNRAAGPWGALNNGRGKNGQNR